MKNIVKNSYYKKFLCYGKLFVIGTMVLLFGLILACTNPVDTNYPHLTGTVIITGNAQFGYTLTADTTGLGGSGSIYYEWKRGSDNIGNNKVYVVKFGDIGSTITVSVSRSDNSGSLTSLPTNIIADQNLPALGGTVSIGGTAQIGQILTADTTALGGSGAISYQWIRNGITIIGSNSNIYTVNNNDAGFSITVRVFRLGYAGSVISDSTIIVTNPNLPALTGTVSISRTAQVGQTITADTSALGGSGTISYQWRKNGVTVTGTNSPIYDVETAGYTITVTVTRSGNSGTVTSGATTIVTDDLSLPVLGGTVSINGVAQAGQILTANISSLVGNGTIFYQWKRNGITIGTNSSIYVLQSSDVGSTITVTITSTGNSRSVTSNSTAVIASSNATDVLLFTLISNNTEYSVSKGTATIESVIIPATYNGLPVTAVDNNGFINYVNLTSIIIPNSVTSIGSSAFAGCNSLTSMTLPILSFLIGSSSYSNANLFGYYFGASSYTNQNSLIPSSLKTIIITGGGNIADYAFYGCNGLTSITIPESVTSIGSYAFYGCDGLTSIIIPESVTSVYSYAFSGCNGLTAITIPSKTSLGYAVFADCNELVNLTIPFVGSTLTLGNLFGTPNSGIPSSLKTVILNTTGYSISSTAFTGCYNLTSITIPDSVTQIGKGIFAGCTSLVDITIPFIGDYPSNYISQNRYLGYFFGASNYSDQNSFIPPSLKTIILTSDNRIDDNAFFGCSSLVNITLPGSLTSIGSSAFLNTGIWNNAPNNNVLYVDKWVVGYKGLINNNINIMADTAGISGSAFSGCSNLTNITIPNNVISIGASAFSNCSSLTDIIIPNSVKNIGGSVFAGCNNLTSISIPFLGSGSNNSYNFLGYFFGASSYTNQNSSIPISLKTVKITGGSSIGVYAFSGCGDLASITIPDSITSIGSYAFSDCGALANITIPDNVTSIGSNSFSGCGALANITIPDSVTSIGNNAFSGCIALMSITIPDSVTSIGRSIFYQCSSLTSLTIPFIGTTLNGTNNVNFCDIFGGSSYIPLSLKKVVITGSSSIGYSFYGCSYLESITIPGSVTSIDDDAFYGCSSLKSITIPGSVTSIDDDAFYGCSSLTSITIPGSVTSIGNSAFLDCVTLTSVTILGKTSIGDNAFYNCHSLMNVTIPGSVTSIGESAFYHCNSLTSINIPGSITSIGNSTFSGCSVLTSITIPDSVTSIGSYAFSGCSALTNIKILDNVTSIGDSAFINCINLTNVTIPGSVTNIAGYTFSGCSSLTSVTIPDGVTFIGVEAFNDCSNLTNITIPASLTDIYLWAFLNCANLKTVYYGGPDISSWSTINIDPSNISLASAVHYYYSAMYPGISNICWHWVGEVPVVWN